LFSFTFYQPIRFILVKQSEKRSHRGLLKLLY